MSRWKNAAVLSVSALTVFAVAACGSDTGSSSNEPKKPSVLELLASDLKGSLQKVVDTTDKVDSVSIKVEGTAANEKFTMQGALDLRDPLKAEITMDAPGDGPTTVRMIGSVFYVEVPEADRADMGGKRWIKMDLAAAGAQAGMEFTKQLEDIDPTKQVKTLLATEGVTALGEETVNGVRTVHYTVTTPVATYLGQLDADARKAVEQELTKSGVKDVKLDLWVDEQYLPRRAHVVMGTTNDITVDYTDYGKPVTVEAPPASETADLAEMLKGLGDLMN
ncbi:LppX_LprAFG lipoprotein [Micromonospora sp. HM5-17]|uniref:LppX_LprAFG lipoprotein n=1 Tax=Micromonospora sp. HM5-17 TaxID=2487710 RepID=UPI000F484CAB|nr:LppX_LprAFG lipoprotein [Micromonospora sp. HM5-17]ROT31251.1 LppX_LprAFG lipoprotein [Micromonospora sp. HM5-17]